MKAASLGLPSKDVGKRGRKPSNAAGRNGVWNPKQLISFAHGRELEQATEARMGGLIYLIGLIVVVLAILSFFGLR
jgi:hypothetical protein